MTDQQDSDKEVTQFRPGRVLWLTLSVGLFLLLASYQLGLPGLHYDEAQEAGVNALQLLTAAPVTAFRGAAIQIGSLSLPLMVQDYIGALNVYLALPFLALTGIGVPNLRFLAIVLAVIALLALERAISEWMALQTRSAHDPSPASPTAPAPISLAALFTLTLLVASPGFVFWNRQGIFVTNLTLPACYVALWQGLRWVRSGQDRPLILAALAAGIALYAKLLAIWIVAPIGIMLLVAGLRRQANGARLLSLSATVKAGAALLIPLLPLVLFNLQTGGTVQSIGGNFGQSYYGVNNTDLWTNLPVRLGQVVELLRGGQFWYLGGIHVNPVAAWIWGTVLVLSLILPQTRRLVVLPVVLIGAAVGLSLFTVSDLFITHYALLQPLVIAVGGISLAALMGWIARAMGARIATPVVSVIISVWLLFDVTATVGYHQDLARSGGLSDHSDAGYHLAYHLRYNGFGAPVTLDWGMGAPVLFLSQGTVRPIEIFGYDSPAQPDAAFAERLRPFLNQPGSVFLLRAPDQTVFRGRREVFFAQSAALGKTPILIQSFAQRDGTPLFELWRIE